MVGAIRIVGAVAMLSLVGCRPSSAPDESRTRLIVGTSGEVTAPSPSVKGGLGATVLDLVFRPLLRGIDGSSAVAELAQSFSWSADGAELRLQLRAGVRFSDGSPVTADDVVDTLSRAKADGAWGTEELLVVGAVGPQAVSVRPSRPFLIPGVLATVGPARRGSSPPVGAGPYLVTNVDPNRLTLSSNPSFDGRPPAVGTIEFRRSASPSDEWSSLLAGKVDLITFVPWNKFDQLSSVPSIRTQSTLSSVLAEFLFISPPPPFDQATARHALALAIDRAELVRTALHGQGLEASGVVWPRSDSYDAQLEPYQNDPAQARRLLESIGCTTDAHGGLHFGGAPLRIEVDYSDAVPGFEALALLIQRQLSGVGIDVRYHLLSNLEMRARILGRGPAILMRPRHATSDLLSDDELRRLPTLPRGDLSTVEAVAEASRLAQRRLRDEAPAIYLVWLNRLDVIDRRFCGLPSLPDGPEGRLDLVHACAPGEDR